ncbi:glycosyltransferase family 9 protein [Naasia sp. SYSU D00948]|uniref:glycosyltransferase family 9 protein n=1 Tax=Naasia sp. SYSU D00948 TaxID=2817379 RepID=UPI001B30B7C4|nr:glycosyltransferase family 9 protein [Naasia sp. SYSU D00948]
MTQLPLARRDGRSGTSIGPLGERIEGVERIAVLRAGNLGDLLFALPAVDALAACYPDAEITLVAMPAHAALLAGRPGPVADVAVLPVIEGVGAAPGTPTDPEEIEAFVAGLRERRFDLAVQVHGGGRYSNPFLTRLGARVTAGLQAEDADGLDRVVPYRYYQHEVLRALEVVGLVGAPPVTLEPVLAVTEDDVARAEELLGPGGPVLAIHPGATDPRRRWPAERFGEIAARAAARGLRAVVLGGGDDAHLAVEVVDAALGAGAPGGSVRSVAGLADLGQLVGILATAAVLVGNDSGPRHLAQAVGCPTVGLYWAGNLINAGPLGRSRHRIQLDWRIECPVCGIDVTQVGWTAVRCEHDPSFLTAISVDAVWTDVEDLL